MLNLIINNSGTTIILISILVICVVLYIIDLYITFGEGENIKLKDYNKVLDCKMLDYEMTLNYLTLLSTRKLPPIYNRLLQKHARSEELYDKYMMGRYITIIAAVAAVTSYPLFGTNLPITLSCLPAIICIERMYNRSLTIMSKQRDRFAEKLEKCRNLIDKADLAVILDEHSEIDIFQTLEEIDEEDTAVLGNLEELFSEAESDHAKYARVYIRILFFVLLFPIIIGFMNSSKIL